MVTTAKYIRMSSLTNMHKIINDEIFIDNCNSSTPFILRESGKILYEHICNKSITTVEIQSMLYFGYDFDMVNDVIEIFKQYKCQLIITDINLSLYKNGRINGEFNFYLNTINGLSGVNKQIKDKQQQGIEIAKRKGLYKGRTKYGSESSEVFLNRYRQTVDIVKESKGKISATAISKMILDSNGKPVVSLPTVLKIIKTLENYN